MLDATAELTLLTKGLTCTRVELYAEHSWSFDFEGKFGINVQCPWRIVNESGIALGAEDHEQKFGLPKPVDGASLAQQLLSSVALEEVVVIEKTGDINLVFESGVSLEIFNDSSGFEGWNCATASGRQVIGMGGGSTAHIVPD
jgi:hypothetical protein